ncbi:hypothetical protein BGZ81_000030 [Podila clonocystis]|nr:hypothetical protein BGZ81_000030 [Podila clonocystis]
MTSLSAFPAGTSPTLSPLSSSAAEALLSRARRLSSKANKKTQSPTSFAEGEDPTALSTPYSSATSSNSHLHQLHRNSFNTYIREQNKKRSSHQHQRLSSTSTAKSTDESPSSPDSPCALKPLNDSTPSEHEHTHTPSAVVVISPSGDDDKQEKGQPQENQPQQQTQQQTQQQAQTEQQESEEAIVAASADPVDYNNDHNDSSGSTEPSTCSLTVVTRPRALTLDSAQKTESTAANTYTPSTTTTAFSRTIAFESIVITDTATLSNLSTPVEKHRRHQSENGTHSGLVHGILEALRDSEPESKLSNVSSSNQEESKDSGVRMTSATLTATSTQGLAQGVAQGHLAETGQEITAAGSSSTIVMSSKEGPSEVHGSSLPTLGANAIIAPPSPNVFLSSDKGAKDDKEQPLLPVQEEGAPAPAPKTAADKAPQRLSINTSVAIPPRSSSALESGVPTAKAPTDSPNNTPAASATSNSLLSPMTPSKKSRRSSNLLGKLVPKFLQTSFAAGSGGGSGSSPRSAHPSTSSSSSSSSSSKASTPLVTRPTRSSTFSGSGSTSDMAKKTTLPVLPMIPPLILETNEMEIRSPDAISPTVAEPEAYLECLRSNSETPTPSLSARRSSCSSDVSKRSNLSMVYSMSSVDPTESNSRIEGIAEEKSEDLVHQEKKQPKEQEQEQEQGPVHSPYTIDENCDDDFFLNSVLRKSRSTHQQQQQQQSPRLSSISTTWMSSTHALSGTASQSSSVSGSPTSPVASPSVLSSSPQSHHFKSYSTPVAGSPIVVGLDEKRSRLRDAVGEWRRATNVSSPTYAHGPSASFSN